MYLCDNCFNDEEMQNAVRNESSEEGECDACGQTSFVVDIKFFDDFFDALLRLFIINPNGQTVVKQIQSDWDMFASDDIGNAIIGYFLTKGIYGYSLYDKVSYIDSITDMVNGWEKLKKDLMEVSRFATDISDYFDPQILSSNSDIKKNTILYRARIIPSGKKYLTKNEMGCPPSMLTPSGRANPQGIPYLYLCQEENTTYYEVRALYLDKLTIGEFKVKDNLRILDFATKMSLYYAYNNSTSALTDEIAKQKILYLISKDLSKPLRRFDTGLEYVPTQYVCEYCKINGVEGIRFNSSLHKGGYNIVLFNSNSAECIKVYTREITNVTIQR